MANIRAVNKAIRQRFPTLGVEAIRGEGYVYFLAPDPLSVPSICANPTTTPTGDMIRMAIDEISATIEKTYCA
jgi:hypothetical protein